MDVSEFWSIMESSKGASDGSFDRYAESLAEHLSALSPERIVAFERKMQQAITALLGLGPLPSSATAATATLQTFEEQLSKVETPITNEEACALVKLFGQDDCFGLAWTLLHLIETAPGWPVKGALDNLEGEWIDLLRERAEYERSGGASNGRMDRLR